MAYKITEGWLPHTVPGQWNVNGSPSLTEDQHEGTFRWSPVEPIKVTQMRQLVKLPIWKEPMHTAAWVYRACVKSSPRAPPAVYRSLASMSPTGYIFPVHQGFWRYWWLNRAKNNDDLHDSSHLPINTEWVSCFWVCWRMCKIPSVIKNFMMYLTDCKCKGQFFYWPPIWDTLQFSLSAFILLL